MPIVIGIFLILPLLSLLLLPIPMVTFILGRKFGAYAPSLPNIIIGQIAVFGLVVLAMPFVLFWAFAAEYAFVIPPLICVYGILTYRQSAFSFLKDPNYILWIGSYLIGFAILTSEFSTVAEISTNDMMRNGMPIDNFISKMLADSLRLGQPLVFGDWLGVDRPPGLAVWFLLFRLPVAGTENYILAGTLIQSLLIPTCVIMVERLFGKLNRWDILFISATVLLTPLTLNNLAFLWPKIISANFLLLFTLFWFGPQRSRRHALLAGLCAGVAVLLHGGAFFYLIGAALVGLFTDYRAYKQAAATLVIFAITQIPWWLYGHFIQQPKDRLLKWHLAGQVDVTEKGLGQVLSDRFHDLGVMGVLGRVPLSLKTQFVDPLVELGAATSIKNFAEIFGVVSFFSIPFSLGLLGYVLIGVAMSLALRKNKVWNALLLVFVATTLSWGLLMNASGKIHEGQYASIYLVLILALGAMITGKGGMILKYLSLAATGLSLILLIMAR